MNSISLLVLLLVNFLAIGLLPRLFFRRDGKFNIRWLATGAPFFVVPATLVLAWFGVVQAVDSVIGAAFATLLSTVSIALIAMTVGTHRIPLALWHQDNDAPAEIVTWGPYARVRHPFYTSFLLAFAAAVVALPHALTVGALLYAFVALSITAVREEKRLSASKFGDEYRNYMSVSGRFLPRISS